MEQSISLQYSVPVSDFVSQCVDVPKFLGYCRQCRSFGKIWSCPPYDFPVEALWRKYQTLWLWGRKVAVPEHLLRQTFQPEEIEAVSVSLLQPVKEQMFTQLLEEEARHPGSMALAAGSCRLCGEGNCTRLQDLPCRHPSRLRFSIESLGGDVGRAAQLYLGETILWGERGHLPPCYLLVGGLLMGNAGESGPETPIK